MSSGRDFSTQIEPGDLFDFPLEVSPILDVLMDRSVSEALFEVLEEEEAKDMEGFHQDFLQERGTMLATMQRMEAREKREALESLRRSAQAREAVQLDAEKERQLAARTLAKEVFSEATNKMVDRLDAVGVFYDPTKKQVEETFVPWLLAKTGQIISNTQASRAAVDQAIRQAGSGLKQIAVETQTPIVRHYKDYVQDSIWLQAQVFAREQEKMAREINGAADLRQSKYEAKVALVRNEIETILQRDRKVILCQSSIRRRYTSLRCKSHIRRMKKRKHGNNGARFRLLRSLTVSSGMTVEFVGGKLLVKELESLGAAAHAGLMERDEIVAVDGEKMFSQKELTALLSDSLPGDNLDLTVLREGQTANETEIITLELFAEDESYTQEHIRNLRDLESLSVNTRKLFTKEKAEFELSQIPRFLGMSLVEEKKELRVRKVVPNGPAARAGILEGDTIYCIGRSRYNNVPHLL